MMNLNAVSNTEDSKAAATTNKPSVGPKEDAKLRAACKGFEALFLNMLLTEMRKTVPKDELTGDSMPQDIMQSMMDTEMTGKMSQAGGTGLADMLYRQLSQPTSPMLAGGNKQSPGKQEASGTVVEMAGAGSDK
jgi:peptidoglycan hydrolase FlgJ